MACFALYRASRAVIGYYRPLLDRAGITYPQLLVLIALWDRDGRTVGELGAELQLDSGTLSPMIKRLEATGLVERQRDRTDERVVTVHLTEAGAALEEEGCAIPLAIGDASDFTAEEFHALREELNRLTDSISRHTGTTEQ